MLIGRLLIATVAAGCLIACGGTASSPAPTPTTASMPRSSTPTPSATAGSQLTITGDVTGEVSNFVVTCGLQRLGADGQQTNYLSATGSLNGAAFLIEVYDPVGPGSWEGGFHVYVRVTPPNGDPNGDYYTWFARSNSGISEFSSTRGVKVAANVPPRTSVDVQAGGLSPSGPINLTGVIVC